MKGRLPATTYWSPILFLLLHIRRTLPPLSFSRRYALPPPCRRRTRESAPIATLRPPCAPLPLPLSPVPSPPPILLPFLPISRHRARVRVSPTTFPTYTIGPDVLLTGNVSFRVAAPFLFRGGASTHRSLHAGVARTFVYLECSSDFSSNRDQDRTVSRSFRSFVDRERNLTDREIERSIDRVYR